MYDVFDLFTLSRHYRLAGNGCVDADGDRGHHIVGDYANGRRAVSITLGGYCQPAAALQH